MLIDLYDWFFKLDFCYFQMFYFLEEIEVECKFVNIDELFIYLLFIFNRIY